MKPVRRDQLIDRSARLLEVSRIIGGRPEPGEDGRIWLVRLPQRLGRGEVYFYDGPAKGIGVDFKRGSTLHLDIGGAGGRWSLATERLAGEEPPVYYAPTLSTEEAVRQWIGGGGRERIKALGLRSEDRLAVYANGITGSLAGTPAPLAIAAFVEAIAALAETLPPPARERRPTVPRGFDDLKSLARKWAVTDDHDRADRVRLATTRSLRQLVDRVKPRLGEIDQELDAAKEPLPDELIGLQSVALAALEAEIELTRREGTRPSPE
jgi:hypothetical protein